MQLREKIREFDFSKLIDEVLQGNPLSEKDYKALRSYLGLNFDLKYGHYTPPVVPELDYEIKPIELTLK